MTVPNNEALQTQPNILIVKLSAIGDVVHALPVAHALKTCWPGARITWVVERPSYDLLTNNPTVDEIIVFDKPRFKTIAGLWNNAPAFVRSLRERRFDLALDLQALFKSAAIVYLSGAPKRLVYCNTREMSDFLSRRVCGPNQQGHIVERLLDVVRALGCPVGQPVFPVVVTAEEEAGARAAAVQAGLDLASGYAVFSPGANWPNKRWPIAYFGELAGEVAAQGFQPVLVGGPGDRALAEAIRSASPLPMYDLTGQTSLKQLAFILRQAAVFIGGDTGPTHLAAALGTPIVGLYGPTDTIRNGPYGTGHRLLVAERSCAGCWKRSCPQGHDCLAAISVGRVGDAVREIARQPG